MRPEEDYPGHDGAQSPESLLEQRLVKAPQIWPIRMAALSRDAVTGNLNPRFNPGIRGRSEDRFNSFPAVGRPNPKSGIRSGWENGPLSACLQPRHHSFLPR